jgi:ribosome-associated protein
LQPKRLALLAKSAAEDKKAEDLVILDISKLSSFAHYFVITHGNSDRQVQAIAHHVEDTLRGKKVKAIHREGVTQGKWALLDYGAVIVHIFYRETREFYGLERLWGDAPRIQ